MKRSDVVFTLLLLPLDYLALVASFLLSYYIRTGFPTLIPTFLLGGFADALHYTPELQLLPFTEYLPFILFISFISLIIFAFTGLYRIQRFATLTSQSRQVFRSILAAFLLLLFAGFIAGNTVLPRLVIVYSLLLAVLTLLLVRWIVDFLRKISQRMGVGVVRLAVLGENVNASRVIDFIKRRQNSNFKIRQYSAKDLEQLYRAIKGRKFDELIIADQDLSEEEVIELRERCIEKRIGFMFIPSVLEMLTSNVIVRDIKGYPLIEVPLTPLEGWGFVVKRVADIIISGLGLIILSPLLLLLALIIYIDSPGPVIFRHQRLGHDLKPFYLFKFRTMRADFCDGIGFESQRAKRKFRELLRSDSSLAEEWSKYHKLKNDPRVTRVGVLLRKLSLDELPQIANVFWGHLSLVGPRPIVKEELEKYGRLQYRLSAIRPGMTGLWQVSGRNDTTYDERVRLDMVYVETWSIWLDIVILLKTIIVLISPRGAY